MATFFIDLTDCDGSTDADIVSAAQCSVPKSTLTTSPYNLPWGSSVQVKVTSENIYGISGTSAVGSGAILLTYPDTPLNFARDSVLNTANSITLTWSEGVADGGTNVLDYVLYYTLTTDYTIL
jgi:hypothetical protein